ncbi:hypothetical protein DFH11DRAFT_1548100 [Phellopilus nigrolimitatus]|nr:hypothetical protein DFH11DRAFT_1548100 [Phellopilus nigrolimitatus]
MPLESAAERVSVITEVLDNILSRIDCSDNARCARTCRKWKDVALDYVWRNNPPLKAVFDVLVPLTGRGNDEDRELVFERALEPDDWERFETYSRRIQMLTISLDLGVVGTRLHGTISDSVFRNVAIRRPFFAILPNLKDLRIIFPALQPEDKWIENSILFLCDELKSIDLVYHLDQELETLPVLLKEIAFRSSHITDFSLKLLPCVSYIEDELADTISRLVYLKRFNVSSCVLTSQIILFTSALLNLQEISVDRDFVKGGFANDAEESLLHFPELQSAFPSLVKLTLQNRLSTITQFVQPKNLFAKLLNLKIDMLYFNTPTDLQACLESLSRACPVVQLLEFVLFEDPTGSLVDANFFDVNPVTSATLSSLPFFPHLTDFSLTFLNPVVMSDDELLALLMRCQKLRSLHLNCEPFYNTGTTLTLGVLALLAHEKKEMLELSIYIDASSEKMTTLPPVTDALSNLQYISFGISPVTVDRTLLLYLSKLLPESCRMDVEPKFSADLEDQLVADVEEQMHDCREGWKKVKDILPLLIAARLDEKERLCSVI